ncbi:hypothetical protein D3C71_617890 [compost metagenome]
MEQDKGELSQSDIAIAKYGAEFSELGVSGLNRLGGGVYEEFLTQLLYPRAAAIYKEMADNDPTIGAILYMMEQLIKKAGWTVKPGGDSAGDIAASDFLKECMDDMRMSWDNTISEILSMFTYGFSFHEVVFKVRKGPDQSNPKFRSKHTDGRIGWAGFPVRSQSSMSGWDFDEQGYVKAFEQSAPPNWGKTLIPLSKGLLFRTKVSRDNPEGRSLLRNAYRPWYFKKRIEEIEGIGIERDLAGLPMLTAPPDVNIWDATDIDASRLRAKAETLVRNVRRDRTEGLLLPNGWEFKLATTGGSRQFDTNAIVNRYDNRIAITMLADIVMMGGDKVGSFALGEVKKSLLAASLEAHIQNIADILNTYAVPKLFKFNYFPGMTDIPKIVPGEVETPDIKELAFLLKSAGLRPANDLPLMNLLRRLVSLEPLTKEELDEWYAVPIEEENNTDTLSSDVDPVGHSMDDNSQNYVDK